LCSVQLICKFSQYHQIKLYGNFNNITAVVTWCLKLNAACLLTWPFWLPCNEQFHSMNVSIITSRSAWKIKWLPNRREADQGSKSDGVYTMLESEQVVWTYYYQMHPLGGADRESNKLCATADDNYFSKFLLQMFLLLLTRARQLHRIGSLHPLWQLRCSGQLKNMCSIIYYTAIMCTWVILFSRIAVNLNT